MSKYLRVFLVTFGALMILGGMWYFDIYANFVGRTQNGDLESLFICGNYPMNPNDFANDDNNPCLFDFFSSYRLNIIVPVMAFQTIGAVLVVLGLTWRKLSGERYKNLKVEK